MPNPWDVGSARALEQMGFKALATTSAGLAWTLGRADNHQVTLDQALEHLRAVVEAVEVPVNADFDANCLAALIGALALGPAHVAGLSWGGTVAQALYRDHPGLVATLILADAYAGWKGSLPEEEVRARVAGVRQTMGAEEFDPTLPGLFAGDPPAEFVPLLDEVAAAVRPESLEKQLLTMAETDQRDLLPRIAVPTLLIWGELDARSPLSVARQLEQAIPDTRLVVIPGCGHVSNLERPGRFNDAVRAFCHEHSPGQA